MGNIKEITVEVDTSYDELKRILRENKFEVVDEYDLNDIYLVEGNCDLKQDPLTILNKCLLIRNLVVKNDVINMITYKHKEYNENEEIVKQDKVDCCVHSIEEAEQLLNNLGYTRLFEISSHIICYCNDETEFAVQLVGDKHIYIELEDLAQTIERHYDSIDEMIVDFKRYNIPIKDNNYFAKKAKNALLEIL